MAVSNAGRRRSIVEGEDERFDRQRDDRMTGKSGRRGAVMMEKERSEQGREEVEETFVMFRRIRKKERSKIIQ